ncbi:hypothetical protein AVEN_66533-1 [Araneus ventricosus]|uniref:Uncharacterized protein n=1 Tax=Araneus ventricosus TaxID=182803 RepID=A0A4Y2EDE9_ARAVE|nr:hypothetical protein AVEN_66533-1 [Araneus ventricosus]
MGEDNVLDLIRLSCLCLASLSQPLHSLRSEFSMSQTQIYNSGDKTIISKFIRLSSCVFPLSCPHTYYYEPGKSLSRNVSLRVGKKHLQRFWLAIGEVKPTPLTFATKGRFLKMLEFSRHLY